MTQTKNRLYTLTLMVFACIVFLFMGKNSYADLSPVQQATQNGLTYIENHAVPWSSNNKGCVGCHVHGASIKALSVGVDKGYNVKSTSLPSLISDLKNHTTSKGVGGTAGTAWEAFGMRYYQKFAAGKDIGAGGTYSDESAYLSLLCSYLASKQDASGRVQNDDLDPPINQGDIQTTAFAAMAWEQDGGFSGNLVLADYFLATHAGTVIPWLVQDEALRILGLIATGRVQTYSVIQDSVNLLKLWQHADGGWGEWSELGSNAYATGLALVALEAAGETFVTGDGGPIDRGINWLIANQITDPSDPNFGAWPQGPTQAGWKGRPTISLFAFTMWPVNALEEILPPPPECKPEGVCDVFLTPKKVSVTKKSEHSFKIHVYPCEPLDVSVGNFAVVFVDTDGSGTFDENEQYNAFVSSTDVDGEATDIAVKVYVGDDLIDNDPKVTILSINYICLVDINGNKIDYLILNTFTPKGKK